MLPVRNKTTGDHYLRHELACPMASRSPAEQREDGGHTLTSSSSLPFFLFLHCHSSGTAGRLSWSHRDFKSFISLEGIMIGTFVEWHLVGVRGPPKTRETQKQCMLGEIGPTVGLKPQREPSLCWSCDTLRSQGRPLSRKKHDAANQISEVKLLGRALIG